MDDPKPTQAVLEALPADLSVDPFRPTQVQALARARLHARLQERRGLVDPAAMTADEIVELSGDRRVRRWLADPEFAAWLLDRDTHVHRAQALKDAALDVLEGVLFGDLEPKVLTAKDKLAAARMLLELTGSFPKAREVRFLDREVDAMDEATVDAELRKLGVEGQTRD